jgi:hypothetical protein
MPLDTVTEPLTSCAEALVDAERERPGPAEDLEARLWERISATVAVPALPPPNLPAAAAASAGACAGLPAKLLVWAMLAVAGAGAGGAIWTRVETMRASVCSSSSQPTGLQRMASASLMPWQSSG